MDDSLQAAEYRDFLDLMPSKEYVDRPGLAAFASSGRTSKGRLYDEAESTTRTPYQRDRDRIIHSGAFRRLKHKTQVFVYHEGDYYRTRLTHSLEVAQIARSMSRVMGLDDDLAEAVALAHDLGHTPFGHAGEDVLQDCMASYNGFDHNAQSLRLVTKLEKRYAEFDGLNLSWEALEGIVKHNGPLMGDGKPQIPIAISEYCAGHDLKLETYASAEAQVAALADDIAYNNHDIDDGLRAGLFKVEHLGDLPVVGDVFRTLQLKYPGLEEPRLIHEAIRRLISIMVNDAIAETRQRITDNKIESADDVRAQSQATVSFSPEMAKADRTIKAFLRKNMYQHYKVNRATSKARRIVRDLFELFVSEPNVLPTDWFDQCLDPLDPKTARVVCDYIAGMTDRFALEEHRRLFQVESVLG